MLPQAINLQEKLAGFTEKWSPKIIARMNDCHLKVVKLLGDFIWHSHPETDEVFYIISGRLQMDFRGESVTLEKGEMIVVPKGVEHKPFAAEECHVLLFEPAGTTNTGDAPPSKLTAGEGEWI